MAWKNSFVWRVWKVLVILATSLVWGKQCSSVFYEWQKILAVCTYFSQCRTKPGNKYMVYMHKIVSFALSYWNTYCKFQSFRIRHQNLKLIDVVKNLCKHIRIHYVLLNTKTKNKKQKTKTKTKTKNKQTKKTKNLTFYITLYVSYIVKQIDGYRNVN